MRPAVSTRVMVSRELGTLADARPASAVDDDHQPSPGARRTLFADGKPHPRRCPRVTPATQAPRYRGRGAGRSRRTRDLLPARRRTWARTSQNGSARGFFGTADGPARGESAVSPTRRRRTSRLRTQKACKYRPFAKRLKGFEPSTFCMGYGARDVTRGADTRCGGGA
jgi:hypothetical protein